MSKSVFFLICLLAGLNSFSQTSCYFLRDTGSVQPETSNSVTELSDGSIYVAGSQGSGPHGNDDVALMKTDACGNVLWIKFYGDTLADEGLGINKTGDGNLIVIGTTGNTGGGNDIMFMKLDTAGNILMQKKYNPALSQSAKWIEQVSDGGFIFCGFISDANGSNDSYAVKVDSAGTVEWSQQIGSTGNEYADAIHQLSDGNFILTGDANSYGAGGYDVEVVKISKTGNIIWDKTYGDNLNNGCQGLIELSNGNYLSYGETETQSSIIFDFFIEMIDTSGNSISRHTFGGTAADALFSAKELPGMNFICTGYSRSFNGFSQYDVVLFKVDSAGQMKWLKNIYSPGIDIGYELIPSINGGYLITGLFADNNGNYFLMRSDTIANTTVGVRDFNTQANIVVSPNPFFDKVNIVGEGSEEAIVYNYTGEKIGAFKTDKNKRENILDLSFLSAGQYILEIQTQEGSIHKKVIKE